MEIEIGRERVKTLTIDTPLIKALNPEAIDDEVLTALAKEMLLVLEQLEALDADVDTVKLVGDAYSEALGIIPSNNMHLWLRKNKPMNPDDPFSHLNNMDSPMFADIAAVQQLRVLRDENPDLFERTGKLSDLTSEAVGRLFNLTKTDDSTGEIPSVKLLSITLAWRLDLYTTQIIIMLKKRGVTDDQLRALYR